MLDHVTDLSSLLKRPDLLIERAYVAGRWVEAEGGRTFEVRNPARGDVIAHVPRDQVQLRAVTAREDVAGRALQIAEVGNREWRIREVRIVQPDVPAQAYHL